MFRFGTNTMCFVSVCDHVTTYQVHIRNVCIYVSLLFPLGAALREILDGMGWDALFNSLEVLSPHLPSPFPSPSSPPHPIQSNIRTPKAPNQTNLKKKKNIHTAISIPISSHPIPSHHFSPILFLSFFHLTRKSRAHAPKKKKVKSLCGYSLSRGTVSDS